MLWASKHRKARGKWGRDKAASWSPVTSSYLSIHVFYFFSSSSICFQLPDNLPLNFGCNSSPKHPFTFCSHYFLFSQMLNPQKWTLIDTAHLLGPNHIHLFIYEIFMENLIYARPSSRCWGKSSGKDKNVCCHRDCILLATDKSLNWQSPDEISRVRTIICDYEWKAGSCGTKCGHLFS